MKNRNMLWIALILTALLLAGCTAEDPYQVDTVIQIPLDPTEATETPTEPATVPETEEPTEPEPTKASKPASSKPAGSKPSGSKPSGGKAEPKETEAPTEAPTAPPVVWTEPPTEPPYDPGKYSLGQLEYDILSAINGRRAEAGVGELAMDRYLCGLAALRAQEVSRVWSHTRPDGRDWVSVLRDYGYGSAQRAERLIYVSGTADGAALAQGWLDAQPEQDLLDAGMTTAGIGIFQADGYTYAACILVG